MSHKFTSRELNRLLTDLSDLGDWFEQFGNYTRAKNIDRLINGIEEYYQDICGETQEESIKGFLHTMPDEYLDEF